MLCSVCKAIDFDVANCSPEAGGAAHQPSFKLLDLSATAGCELCNLIRTKAGPPTSDPDAPDRPIYCNIWNWFDGPEEVYMGSSTIIFYSSNPTWSVILGIAADENSIPATTKRVSGRRAHLTANSKPCFDLATKWVANCLSDHHASCPRDTAAILPTRVIDVGLDLDSPRVKVLETNGARGAWVALSHCWGRVARFVTETSNLQERIEGITLSELPKTFADSIVITRKLGYRYIWIDSLCILQDSHQDWVDESSKMQDYYSKAVLTVASDLATGDHESFLDNPRSQSTSVKVPFNTKNDLSSQSYAYIFRGVKTPGTDADETPLSVRGWTLQEDILSPRSLHYTERELVFECQQSRFVETDVTPQGYNDVDQMRSIKRFFLHPNSGLNDPMLLKYPAYAPYYKPLSRWYRLFENYCTRLLTFESDRLAAIAGLAKEIRRQTSYNYRAGIWEEDLHSGLLWSISGRGERPTKYRAPSWSWASLDISFYAGNVVNPDFELYSMMGNWGIDPNSDSETSRKAKMLGCKVSTVNGDCFAPIIKGELRLKGFMLPISKWKGKMTTYVNVYWRPVRSHQRGITPDGIKKGHVPSGIWRAQPDQLVCDFDETVWDEEEEEEEEEEEKNPDSGFEDNKKSEAGNSSESEGKPMEETEDDVRWRTERYLRLVPGVVLFQVQRYVRPVDASNEVEKSLFACLLLQPSGNEEECLEYRRVGIAEVPDTNGLGREGWTEAEITII